jgi:hypothetical protein
LTTIASKVSAAETGVTTAKAAFDKAQTNFKTAALTNAKDEALADSAAMKT